MISAGEALDLGCRLAGLAFLHDGVQLIITGRDFEVGGLLDRELTQQRHGRVFDRLVRRVLGTRAVRRRVWTSLPYCQVGLGIAIIILPMRTWPLLGVYICELLLRPQLRGGSDGGDEMLRVVTPALLLASLAGPSGQLAATAFLTLQAILAYTASGLSKAQSSLWWSGRAMAGILSTQLFGRAGLARTLDKYPVLSMVLGWLVVVGESISIIGVLLGPTIAGIFLITAALFHLLCALVMGLDGFLLPFVATYPSFIVISDGLATRISFLGRAGMIVFICASISVWLSRCRKGQRHSLIPQSA